MIHYLIFSAGFTIGAITAALIFAHYTRKRRMYYEDFVNRFSGVSVGYTCNSVIAPGTHKGQSYKQVPRDLHVAPASAVPTCKACSFDRYGGKTTAQHTCARVGGDSCS